MYMYMYAYFCICGEVLEVAVCVHKTIHTVYIDTWSYYTVYVHVTICIYTCVHVQYISTLLTVAEAASRARLCQ